MATPEVKTEPMEVIDVDANTTEAKDETKTVVEPSITPVTVEATPAPVAVEPTPAPVKVEPASAPAVVATTLIEKPKPSVSRKDSELEKYWKPVKDNPSDFTGWTYLLQYVDQENNLDKAREAYEAFLAVYPYCYGYWKKYADLEKRHNDNMKVIEVFEKGVKAIPLSSELWLHYIGFYNKEFILEEGTRKLYERALKSAGTDFRSDKLWDSYITWEKERDVKRVTALYDRLFHIPTQLYSHHFDNFKKFVMSHHPKDILNLDEFIKLRTEVVKDQQGLLAPGPDGADTAPPGEDLPPGESDAGGTQTLMDSEEAMKVRDKIMKLREDVYKANVEEISRRWSYEEGIKRPYFHVKPLERTQLKNWREYLDFELNNKKHERIVVLFERCMIAAALYEDFWIKYARYLEEHLTSLRKAALADNLPADNIKMMEEHGFEAVRSVYRRACTIHLPKKPYIHMAWAAFEERNMKHSDAWRILTNLEEQVPGMVMVAMRRISLERRIGDKEKTQLLFQEYIDKATDQNIRAFYVIKYSRFLYKVLGDEIKAKKILFDALEKDPTNEKVYVQLLDMEYQKHPVDVTSALSIFTKAITSEDLSMHMRIKMSQRRLEFLEDFGSSILELKECYDEHQKLLKDSQTDKKRKLPDTSVPPPNISQPPPEKKAKTNGTSGTSTVTATGDQPPDYSAYWAQYNTSSGYNYPTAWGSYAAPQYYNTS